MKYHFGQIGEFNQDSQYVISSEIIKAFAKFCSCVQDDRREALVLLPNVISSIRPANFVVNLHPVIIYAFADENCISRVTINELIGKL